MLHILFLIVCGMILTGWLSGIIEQLGMKSHYWAVLLAACSSFWLVSQLVGTEDRRLSALMAKQLI